MRPLLVVLHDRPLQSLSAAARFWEIAPTESAAELTGLLYPILTDAWQVALALERLGELAEAAVRTLVERRLPLSPNEIAQTLDRDEGATIAVLRQLYVAGLLATEPSAEGPRVFLPNEVARVIQRLEHERSEPIRPNSPLPALVAQLTDHELLELAERYGLAVIPSVTSRDQALGYLVSRLADPTVLHRVCAGLSPRARQLLTSLESRGAPLPLSELLRDRRWTFGELRRIVSELARSGLVWRTFEGSARCLMVLPALTLGISSTPILQPIEAVSVAEQAPANAAVLDLLLLLACLLRSGTAWPRESRPPRPLAAATAGQHWFREDASDPPAYFIFLRRCAGSLGLLTPRGALARPRLAAWLRAPFAEQQRRLFRAWSATIDPRDRDLLTALVRQLRALRVGAWYEWDEVVRESFAGSTAFEREETRLQELEWLGIVQRGRTPAGTRAIRLTLWGSWTLGILRSVPLIDTRALLETENGLKLELSTLTPEITWIASLLGTLQSSRPVPTWLLTARTVETFVRTELRSGLFSLPLTDLPAALIQLLERALGSPLPATWQETIRAWLAHSRPAIVRPALAVRFTSTSDRDQARALLERVVESIDPLDDLTLVVWLPEPKALGTIETVLRKGGFLVELQDHAGIDHRTKR
ncbi:MAG: hypothetical protein J7450_03475 [Thermomicrobium sp.]|uniref:hypothetical protein n=1 Tax=Thermomicrobium sp. TaxID=1969469 RepID=UPI001B25DFCE|nr:hypothetical protein [Thermomicrobium sp.]MBO9358610.1 hypothetical protein [Thermomicrobium sp.]